MLTLGGTLHLVIVELAGKKDTTEILQRLNKAYPVADDEGQAGVQELLGPTNERIVNETRAALAAGDMQRVRAALTAAAHSTRLVACAPSYLVQG